MNKDELYEELLSDEDFLLFLYHQKQLRMRLMDEELQSTITDGEVIEVEPDIETGLNNNNK
jgi:hypothetical protein